MSRIDDENHALEQLRQRFATLADLSQINGLLSWDQQTYMPGGAAAARGQQQATLDAISHQLLTDRETGELIARLEQADGLTPDKSAFLRLARRAHGQATKLPAEFVETVAKDRALSQQAWLEARQDGDFGRFAPHLERMFELARQQAEYLGYEESPYDALHDLYEPGSTAAAVRAVFEPLREETVALVREIMNAPAIDDSCLSGEFGEAPQEQFALEVITAFGYDLGRGRLDRTVHPFAQGMGRTDVRITTRYRLDFLNTALFGTLHEAGHGIYEQGLPEEHQRSPVGESVSLAVHESQSRMWENLVGRGLPFWQGAYPRLQELFPQFGRVPLEEFYAAINRVAPSLIRVEADEITYNLHIMVRFELEQALLAGDLAVADLPAAWNERYRDYLGITPENDVVGCLQDVHWSVGLIGYFPTYTLGNVMSVQLFDAAKRAHPAIEEEIRAGRFDTLLGWLRENVHRHGSLYLPDELLRRATGSSLDAAPYVRYLNEKYRALYGLDR